MLDIPNEIKVGVCAHWVCEVQLVDLSSLKWKMGKETGGKKFLAYTPASTKGAKGNEIQPTGPGPPAHMKGISASRISFDTEVCWGEKVEYDTDSHDINCNPNHISTTSTAIQAASARCNSVIQTSTPSTQCFRIVEPDPRRGQKNSDPDIPGWEPMAYEEVCRIYGESSDESDAENIDTGDEIQPLLWDARDWMKGARVEVCEVSGYVREKHHDVLMGEICLLDPG